jgi:hypothetical protein
VLFQPAGGDVDQRPGQFKRRVEYRQVLALDELASGGLDLSELLHEPLDVPAGGITGLGGEGSG